MNTHQAEIALAEELRRIAPDIDVSEINRDGDLREEFDIDSMDFLNLVTALNERLGIPIPEPDYRRFATYASAIAYIAKKAP